MHSNVLTLPASPRAPRRGRQMMRNMRLEQAEILKLDRPTDDVEILLSMAPWMRGQPDCAQTWHSGLFISRLDDCIKAATGASCLVGVVWKARNGNIRGTIDTPSGKLNIDVWAHGTGGHATVHGHRSTLVNAGIAQAGWLYTESRKGRRTEFQCESFDAQRSVNITRSGERYFLRFDLTEEEVEVMRCPERLANAQADVQREIDRLPKTAAQYIEFFTGIADLQAKTMQMVTCESRGGFALDDRSRAAILVQLDGLRQVIVRAKAKFDRGERRSEIACIVQKHAPSNKNLRGAKT